MSAGAGRRGRGRALLRLVVVLTAVLSMMLAPVVTWPSSGSSSHPAVATGAEPSFAR